ncbi:MAG: hypothetical protein FDZ69_05570 [Deltaproteobacteria bacterium]|nr:MAG: hypothetical protein FDZ69_05570 [Deltaproteobacteria bacterium]
MKRLLTATLAAAGLLLGAAGAVAGETPARPWGGSLRSLNLRGAEGPGELFPAYRFSSSSLRLETAGSPREAWRLEGAVDYQLLGADPVDRFPVPGGGVNRRFDLDHSWRHDRDWQGRIQVDRLSLGWSSARLDATIGRQAIGFGRIVIFSPLDIIAPFPVDAIDTDVRPGVDAVRLTGHYGLDGQLGAVAVFGDTARHDSYLATWADNRGGIDLLALGGVLRHRPMLGAGLAGSLGSLGLKGEAAYFEGERVGAPGGDPYRRMLNAAIEGWYRFDNGLTLIVQYLHNGCGSRQAEDYPAIALSAPLREGLTNLLGRHYLLAAPSLELHPLVTLNSLLIWNLADDSWLLRPSLAVNLADNLSLELFWIHPDGPPHRSRPLPFPPELRSEFGDRGKTIGFFMKWFF